MHMMRISRQFVVTSLIVLLAACAPTTPPGLDVSTQNPPPTTPVGEAQSAPAAMMPVGVQPVAPAPAPDTGRLSLMQICGPTGAKCTLAFVDSNPTEDVSRLVRDYFVRTGTTPTPQVSVESNCATGWVASVLSEQGTVLGGGLLHAQAAVCGHPDAMSAINKALDICDAQTSGGCRKSSRIKVVWGMWDGRKLAGRDLDPGRPYEAWNYPGGQSCESIVPVVESGTCSRTAAETLRRAGVRFP